MKKEYVLAVFLALPILFLAFWLMRIECALNAEKTVIVRMMGYDPRDLLSGHYLYLRPDWSNTDCRQFDNGICPQGAPFEYSYRYYLPEFEAQKIDAQLQRSDLKVEMVFTYKGSAKPLVKELLIEGKPWADWFKQSVTQPDVP